MRFTMPKTSALCLLMMVINLTSGCDQSPTQAQTPELSPKTTIATSAGIQHLMRYMIDPSADFLWESVSESITENGVEAEQPDTDAEWLAIKRQAFILTEGANLLQVDGRHVVHAGGKLEDHGTEGNLTTEEVEQAIAADRETFNTFAVALHDVGTAMMTAADNHDPQGIVEAGEVMDQVCESCHLKFWYPGQQIPAFDNQAPEVKDK